MIRHLQKYWWIILSVLLIALFLVNISLGSVHIPIGDTVRILFGMPGQEPVWSEILYNFRLTKAITAILAGAGLSLGGLLMQTLFRNPLAGPDVLGLSSGASLAVALLIMAGGGLVIGGPFAIAIAASVGCVGIFIIILFASRKVSDPTSLLIIGLMVGAATSSIVSVLQFISRAEEQHYFLIWTFGSLGGLNWNEIVILSIIIVSGVVLAVPMIKPLNAWLLGSNYAISIGTPTGKTQLLIIIITCILTGAITAFCGPIAFVGLAVPHLTRLMANTANHKTLIPGVLLCGASVMLFCDTIAQLPGSAYVLPINAITALIGAPVVIWIILRHKKIHV